MGQRIQRLTDVNSGGGVISDTSPNTTVYANGLLVSIDGSVVNPHSRHDSPTTTLDGSASVFVHGIPVNFETNVDKCGHIRINGSSNVFVDDAGISYLRDNTLDFGIAPPVGMQPYTSPFVQYIFEKDDQESADPPGTREPGIVAEDYPIPSVIEANMTESPETTTPTHICATIEALPLTFDWSTLGLPYDTWSSSTGLSPHFTVYDLTVGPAVSTWQLTNNVGLTQRDILRNLCFLTNVVIEDMLSKFPDMIITSGFRAKSGTSQHNKGQAVDIQVPGFTSQQYWDGAIWIKDHINFDQFILEYGGRNPWYHISVNPVSHRHQVLTCKGANTYVPGLVRIV